MIIIVPKGLFLTRLATYKNMDSVAREIIRRIDDNNFYAEMLLPST